MELSSDFKDLLSTFNRFGVRYIVIGAHAVGYHVEPRYTKDLDVWVEPTPDNAMRTWEALREFGAPLRSVRPEDFLNPDLIYQVGVPPVRIDVLAGVAGITFSTAWKNRVRVQYGDVAIYVLGRADLIRAKLAAGRPRDLLDVKDLRLSDRVHRSKRPRKKRRK